MKINEYSYNWAFIPNNRGITKYAILHHAACNASPGQIHDWHKAKGWAGIAYHFYIRKDGTIYRGRNIKWIGGHTTGYNSCSVGVCFEGNFENEQMPTAQIQAGREIVDYLMEYYPGIEFRKHKDFQATACPGKNFPFDSITQGVSKEPVETDAEKTETASKWAMVSTEKAIGKGAFTGDGKSYRWHDPITREEVAVVLDNLKLLD